jgi:hypothetical protein
LQKIAKTDASEFSEALKKVTFGQEGRNPACGTGFALVNGE